MPFEIKRIGPVLWRGAARLDHRVRFLKGNIEDAHLAGGGDVSNGPALTRCRRLRRHCDWLRILEAQQTSREIRVAIAAQVEHERFRDTRQPDAARDTTAFAV